MRTATSNLKLVGAVAAPLLVVVAAVALLVVRASGEAPDPLNQPGSPCWDLANLEFPPEKAALVQEDCDAQKAALERFERSGGVKSIPEPPAPVPSAVSTVPPCNDQWKPTAGNLGCVLYGVLEGHQPPAGYEKVYLVEDAWAGTRYTVYVGALYDDPDQGVVVVIKNNTWPPERLGDYRSPTKEGRLRILDAQGDTLSIVSAGGTRYSFNADTRALAKQ
jgi:hypothetical protein